MHYTILPASSLSLHTFIEHILHPPGGTVDREDEPATLDLPVIFTEDDSVQNYILCFHSSAYVCVNSFLDLKAMKTVNVWNVICH